ncbi:hypothetical protein [Asticcacaulis sp. YBE204]|uniref:hypothetical protein n=1 Tax=Asticcacaulis sp. YBE204 TaxID=1282363 RepID=UPI0003C3B609|nr:hypothetical protein [Asticcacaulis sp. YBE204]ESQ79889.1 hypothetical protein AEYBE204_08565 [Asticcacaulis sp. YBE204]
MRTFIFLLAISLSLISPAAGHADVVKWDSRTLCSASYAQWAWRNPNLDVDTEPSTTDVKGLYTNILTCTVGGHHVRINWRAEPNPFYRCGATENGILSAWVDGVKVVDKAAYGDYQACQGGDTKTLVKLIINKQLNLTLCVGDPFDSDTKPDCALTPLDLKDKPREALYAAPLKATPPALILHTIRESICDALTPDLNRQTEDPIALKVLIGTTSNFGKDIDLFDLDKPIDRTFTADIDNDNKTDHLRLHFEPTRRNIPGIFSWQSGAQGREIVIDGRALGDKNPDTELIDDLRFVKLNGRVYLYRLTLSLTNGFVGIETGEVEAYFATLPDLSAVETRQLYELSPDGKIKPLCGWSPRQRPEEYL